MLTVACWREVGKDGAVNALFLDYHDLTIPFCAVNIRFLSANKYTKFSYLTWAPLDLSPRDVRVWRQKSGTKKKHGENTHSGQLEQTGCLIRIRVACLVCGISRGSTSYAPSGEAQSGQFTIRFHGVTNKRIVLSPLPVCKRQEITCILRIRRNLQYDVSGYDRRIGCAKVVKSYG